MKKKIITIKGMIKNDIIISSYDGSEYPVGSTSDTFETYFNIIFNKNTGLYNLVEIF